jgi:hypothetical protein
MAGRVSDMTFNIAGYYAIFPPGTYNWNDYHVAISSGNMLLHGTV